MLFRSLTNCIHGADIDQQAAEVTVMSLYLKMLESKLPANWQTEWVETRLLPALDNNILCGNSLIDDDGEYLKSVSTPLRGGWYRTFPQFLRQVPIKIPETAAEKKLAARITDSVKAIMAAKASLQNTMLSDQGRSQLERTVENNEKRIDVDVFKLYGVDGLPVES